MMLRNRRAGSLSYLGYLFAGLAMLYHSVIGVIDGEIFGLGTSTVTGGMVHRESSPIFFWVMVAIFAGLGSALIIQSIRGFKKMCAH